MDLQEAIEEADRQLSKAAYLSESVDKRIATMNTKKRNLLYNLLLAAKQYTELQSKIDSGELVEVVRCGSCGKHMTAGCSLCSFDGDGSFSGAPISDFYCADGEKLKPVIKEKLSCDNCFHKSVCKDYPNYSVPPRSRIRELEKAQECPHYAPCDYDSELAVKMDSQTESSSVEVKELESLTQGIDYSFIDSAENKTKLTESLNSIIDRSNKIIRKINGMSEKKEDGK